jgi:hypothetical protein
MASVSTASHHATEVAMQPAAAGSSSRGMAAAVEGTGLATAHSSSMTGGSRRHVMLPTGLLLLSQAG